MTNSHHHRNMAKIIAVAAVSSLLTGCGGTSATSDEEKGILIRAGEHNLTLQDVLQKIPTGIEPSDSATLFHLIVENWIKSEVLYKLAESKLSDTSEIDKKVAEYRNRLIVAEYLDEMKNSANIGAEKDSIRYFYDRHKNDMLTESPLVKGIYLKVSTANTDIDEMRQMVSNGSDESIDRLEQLITGNAVQYDYFNDEWIDWQIIEDLIPYRFPDPDGFLESTSDFETSYDGSTYFLHVSEYLPSGSVPPYEFAVPHITQLLERTNMRKYEESLVKTLVRKAMEDGDLVAVGYNPLDKNMISQ